MRHNPSIAHARVYTGTYNHTVWARAPSLLLLLCLRGFVEVLRFTVSLLNLFSEARFGAAS